MHFTFSCRMMKPRKNTIQFIKQLQTISSSCYLKNDKNQSITNVILQNTNITNRHLIPEINLHLITSDFLGKKTPLEFDDHNYEDPFWGFLWPGGQVLSRYILDNSGLFKNRSIIDIGCGCGATAIAAAKSNAKKVIANDNDPIACVATALNAKINNVELEILQGSVVGEENIPWDFVLMGDMFYEELQSSQSIDWLNQLYKQGKTILIGDPGRLPLQKHRGANFNLMRRMAHSSSDLYNIESHKHYLSGWENQNKIELIKQYTNISYDHITPEICLRVINEDSEAWAWKQSEIKLKDPFWAFYWPGGQALTRYILDNPQEFKNETILDVGCGSGATSIACARVEALEVVANDCHIDACIATALNAESNNVNVQISQENYIGNINIPWNCILIGDMFYDDELFCKIHEWLKTLRSQNKKIFIGDPGRLGERDSEYKKNFKRLKTYFLKESTFLEGNKFSCADVLTFC